LLLLLLLLFHGAMFMVVSFPVIKIPTIVA
jgi:hypothetical protein